jgi:hypothetical protein
MKHLERYALSVSHEIHDQVFPKQKDLVLGRYPIHIFVIVVFVGGGGGTFVVVIVIYVTFFKLERYEAFTF